MVSTRHYRQDIFNRLTKVGLDAFGDLEALELHQRASDLVEEATLYDDDEDKKNSHARVLYREAQDILDDMDEVLEEREKY